ncbi:MAG: DNA translocase FtsK [Lachnospiraceae bacterium]|nr:DNA translocase FtsK [Lachnospiraceae bacterium]
MANGKNTTKRKTTTKNSSTAKKNAPVKRSTTAKKSAPAKKNTVTKNSVNKPVQKEPYVPTEQDIKLKNEIVLLVGLAITVLLTLANFGLLSPFGDYLSYFMFGLFGFLAYGLPVCAFIGVAFYLSNRNNHKCIVKLIAGVSMYILICAFIQMIKFGKDTSVSVLGYYKVCGAGKSGGGIFGAMIQKALYSLFGGIGTYFILILLIIITVILLTEKSFIGGVKTSSKKVYDTAKNDVEKIRETSANIVKERRYKKNRRINKKVKGVRIQKLSDGRENEEDIHEIRDIHEKLPEYAQVYRGHVDTAKYETKETSAERTEKPTRQTRRTSRPSADMEEITSFDNKVSEPQYDEEGLFKPKEQIIVSKEAKGTMARKPFETTASVNRSGEKVSTEKAVVSEKVATQGSSKKKNKKYILPSTSMLNKGSRQANLGEQSELKQVAKNLEIILENFGVRASVTDYSRGPSVTRYEIQPETGTRLSKITSLADDIKLNLAATDIRIEPIPGKSTIGIEVPNKGRDSVLLRDLIETKELSSHGSMLTFPAGMDIAGNVVVGDIAKMPHMLVAGTTGSGKSVFTNSIIMSILFRATPNEVRFIIVDPKVVEFGVYNGIPHLLQPVVTDPKKASNTLKWAVAEMSNRYKMFADVNVRDLKGYNEKIKTMQDENGEPLESLPQILIVIDELADLMMVAAKEVEESICRLAQLARAAGIHLIIATQRPSVDVVTGLIKANIPSRCALMVSSGVDSRTIIDSNGAEKLLGNGDMLFYPSGYVKPVRLQGAFVSDAEVQKVVDFWKNQAGNEVYDNRIEEYLQSQPSNTDSTSGDDDGRDEYFYDAARFVIEKEKASTSMIQRMFKVGFNRAARIVDQLYQEGIVGSEEGTKPRKVLMTLSEFEEKYK